MSASSKSLSALLAQTSLEDHDEVLKAANAAVKKSKSDVEAHHVKAVALLHLDRYDDALDVFEHTPELQKKAVFEYAYALYKTGNAAKAVEVADAASSDHSRGMKHMIAQAVRLQLCRQAHLLCRAMYANSRHRHTAPRTLPAPERSTRSLLASLCRTKSTTSVSTLALSTHS